MKKQLGGGRGGGVGEGLFGAMQAVGVGGACCVEESWNVTRVCQTVLFYICLPTPPPAEVMLQCERDFSTADFSWLVCVFFLSPLVSRLFPHHAWRRVHIQTNTHA